MSIKNRMKKELFTRLPSDVKVQIFTVLFNEKISVRESVRRYCVDHARTPVGASALKNMSDEQFKRVMQPHLSSFVLKFDQFTKEGR